MGIVKRIRYLCDQNGITLNQLEKAIGLKSTIARWDDHDPGVDKVRLVAQYFGVSVARIIEGPDFESSGLRLPSAPEPLPRQPGLVLGGTKKPASPQADGIIDKIIALDPEMRELFVRILAAAKADPGRVKRYLAFLAQELESQH